MDKKYLNMKIRKVILVIITLNFVLLNGCWDIREINELGMVTAVGIDKGDGPNKYVVTVQIANQSSDNTSESKGGGDEGVWIGTQEGKSLFEATRKLVGISSKRIMWAHNNVIIIGESMAKEGIVPVVDFFTHNPELRLKTAVVVSEGNAKDYIWAKIGMEEPSGVSFIMLEWYRGLGAESVDSNMLQVSGDLQKEYSNALIAGIRLEKSIIGSGEENKGKSSETVELSGAAVFKKDKMKGWISAEESRGVSWIFNQTKNTVVTVTDPEHDNKSVSVETKSVKAKFKSQVKDGIPRVFINVSGKGIIVEEDGPASVDIGEVKRNVRSLVNKEIKAEIEKGIEAVQKKYMIDVLGFADIVHVQNDEKWHDELKYKWEEVFPKIPVTVSVDINIISSALNQKPIQVK